jgi:2-polyprenyl-3-methyl-5-hydroxy-6-metoxy-1,4-benzoquinol methylase
VLLTSIKEKRLGFCSLCRSKKLKFYSYGYDYESKTCSNRWTFKNCENCGHIQLDPRPDETELGIIYPSNYYSYELSKKINPIISTGKNFLDQLKIKLIKKYLRCKLTSYMDIGCGDGKFLKLLEKKYHLDAKKIFGIELNKDLVKKLKREKYIAINSPIENIKKIKTASISLITMFHVIEHVSDPGLVIKKLSKWLAKGGVLAIETPNIDSIDAQLFRNTYWGGYHFPRHWHLFNEETLSKLLKDSGINPIKISYQTGHSFWMFSFHHLALYKFKNKKIAALFNPLKSIVFLILFTLFDKVRAFMGVKTSSVLIIGQKI